MTGRKFRAEGAGESWRMAFWVIWASALIVKLVLAAALAPFGDEAWYWEESRALAWSFSDLPPATALLIRAGESLFGHGVLAMRLPFVLLGAAVPLVLRATATRLFGASAGDRTGLLACALPLLGTLGMFALPDAPLTLCAALALDALERAVRDGRRRDWLLLGAALAAAWITHYRAAMLVLAGIGFLALSARGRRLWSTPGMWLAVAVSIGGLVPLLVFNLEHDWVALGFQLVDRNPWRFHADGLLQPVEQAIVCTPLFFALLLWALAASLRRVAQPPWDLLAITAAVPLAAYLVLGCFADDTRLRLHWMLPGYLPLLIALPALLDELPSPASRLRRAGLVATLAALALGSVAVFGYFAMAAVPGGALALTRFKAFPEHWVGWNEVADRTRALLGRGGMDGATLVADNFMLAAELDFAGAAAAPTLSLDHPINAKHGRAAQLALWRRDEAAARALGHRRLLLVIEPTARRERERAAWLAEVCARTIAPSQVERLVLYGGRKRFVFLQADGIAPAPLPGANAGCIDDS